MFLVNASLYHTPQNRPTNLPPPPPSQPSPARVTVTTDTATSSRIRRLWVEENRTGGCSTLSRRPRRPLPAPMATGRHPRDRPYRAEARSGTPRSSFCRAWRPAGGWWRQPGWRIPLSARRLLPEVSGGGGRWGGDIGGSGGDEKVCCFRDAGYWRD